MLTVPYSISHQIVRHRIDLVYSQPSQCYIDLSKEPLKVITPVPELDASDLILWRQSVEFSVNSSRPASDLSKSVRFFQTVRRQSSALLRI